MNWKQIICIWLGITAFVFVGLATVQEGEIYLLKSGMRGGYSLLFPKFLVVWICIIVVTIGLIYTFRGKNKK